MQHLGHFAFIISHAQTLQASLQRSPAYIVLGANLRVIGQSFYRGRFCKHPRVVRGRMLNTGKFSLYSTDTEEQVKQSIQ